MQSTRPGCPCHDRRNAFSLTSWHLQQADRCSSRGRATIGSSLGCGLRQRSFNALDSLRSPLAGRIQSHQTTRMCAHSLVAPGASSWCGTVGGASEEAHTTPIPCLTGESLPRHRPQLPVRPLKGGSPRRARQTPVSLPGEQVANVVAAAERSSASVGPSAPGGDGATHLCHNGDDPALDGLSEANFRCAGRGTRPRSCALSLTPALPRFHERAVARLGGP